MSVIPLDRFQCGSPLAVYGRSRAAAERLVRRALRGHLRLSPCRARGWARSRVRDDGAREPDLDADAYTQALAAFAIIEEALLGVGSSLEAVVRTVTYVRDMADADLVARAHCETLGHVRPAATLVAVTALLDPRMRVEIEVYAIELYRTTSPGDGDWEREVLSTSSRQCPEADPWVLAVSATPG